MPTRRQEPLLRVSAFEVLIGDRELGFAHVGPLTSGADPDSDAPLDRRTRQFAPIVLRRALTASTELFDWRKQVVEGSDDRRDITIRQLSAPGGKPVNAWRLVRALPTRWTGPSFDALSNDVAHEELELTFEDLVWLDPGTS